MGQLARLIAPIILLSGSAELSAEPISASSTEGDVAMSEETSHVQPLTPDSSNLQVMSSAIEILSNQVAEVRRDQLNYSIEKGLLKESYSSSITTVNVVLTVVMLFFSALTYVGFRRVSEQKADYEKELSRIRALRRRYSIAFKQLNEGLAVVRKQQEDIKQVNELQNVRLTVLEAQERATRFLNEGNFSRCLEYIDAALDLDPTNAYSREVKLGTLGMLGRFEQAIEWGKLMVRDAAGEPGPTSMIEYGALTGKRPLFDDVSREFGAKAGDDQEWIFPYAETLLSCLEGDVERTKDYAKRLAAFISHKGRDRFEHWSVHEATQRIVAAGDGPAQRIALGMLDFVKGKKSVDQFTKGVESVVAP